MQLGWFKQNQNIVFYGISTHILKNNFFWCRTCTVQLLDHPNLYNLNPQLPKLIDCIIRVYCVRIRV